MSLSESALLLDRARVPDAEAIIRQVARHGYSIAFPAGFAVAEGSADWVPVKVNGAVSGFDYGVHSRAGYAADDPEAPALPEFGDTVLAFAARQSQTSLLAVALIQRAICELSDAQGWWHEGEEHLGNAEMIKFCSTTIEAVKAAPQAAAAPRQRLDSAYFRTVALALAGFAAVLGAVWLLGYLAGTLFPPGAPQ